MPNFFKILRYKTREKTKPETDERFWDKFEQEFGKSAVKRRLPLWWPIAAPVGLTAILAVALLVSQKESFRPEIVTLGPALNEMFENQELFETFELIEEFEEFAELSDEEWELLLEENS